MDQIVKRPQPADTATIEQALALDARGMRRRSGRGWLWTVLLLVIAAAGAGGYFWYAQSPTPVSYATVPAERGNLVVEVTATGTLQPLTQVDVSSELSGVMRSVAVEENARVARGQVLAQLDTTRITAQIERAEANVQAAAARVTEAKVTLTEAEQAFGRAEQLAGRGMVAEQVLDTARAARDRAASAVETADANLAIARADLKLQQADLAKSTIYAPIDGIVLTRSVNPGQTVASSMSAPVLFVIAENLETMVLEAAIDEADIGAVENGQEARFTVDAFPARRFDATISDISYASVTTEGVVTYEAKLAVDNKALLLRPGMTATVNIVTRDANDVLLVPVSAFRFSPPEASERRSFTLRDLFMPRMGRPGGFSRRGGSERDGGRTLWVLEDGQPARKSVEIGATSGDMTEVISGIEPGEQVITGIAQTGERGRRP